MISQILEQHPELKNYRSKKFHEYTVFDNGDVFTPNNRKLKTTLTPKTSPNSEQAYYVFLRISGTVYKYTLKNLIFNLFVLGTNEESYVLNLSIGAIDGDIGNLYFKNLYRGCTNLGLPASKRIRAVKYFEMNNIRQQEYLEHVDELVAILNEPRSFIHNFVEAIAMPQQKTFIYRTDEDSDFDYSIRLSKILTIPQIKRFLADARRYKSGNNPGFYILYKQIYKFSVRDCDVLFKEGDKVLAYRAKLLEKNIPNITFEKDVTEIEVSGTKKNIPESNMDNQEVFDPEKQISEMSENGLIPVKKNSPAIIIPTNGVANNEFFDKLVSFSQLVLKIQEVKSKLSNTEIGQIHICGVSFQISKERAEQILNELLDQTLYNLI